MTDGRRLAATLSHSGDEFTLEFASGRTASEDRLAPGVTLERSGDHTPLRLRLTGLRDAWLTNIFLSPAVTCSPSGGTQLRRPDGTVLYFLGIGGPANEHPIYFAESRLVEDQ